MYTKKSQLKRTKTSKVCIQCNKKRAIRFFDKPTSHKCKDCLRKNKRLKKQSSKSYLNKKKDEAWATAVKIKAGYKCEYSGVTKNLNAHHIYSRSNRAVRWDIDNGVCLSSKHHVLSSTFSAHKTSLEFIEWIKEKRGEDWYNRLRTKARTVKKVV